MTKSKTTKQRTRVPVLRNAYVQDGTTWDFASNAVQVTFVK